MYKQESRALLQNIIGNFKNIIGTSLMRICKSCVPYSRDVQLNVHWGTFRCSTGKLCTSIQVQSL